MRPLGFNFLAELVRAALLEQDLDARLVDVVAPPVAVVDPQDRLEVGEEVRPREELADDHADHRRPPEAAAYQHAKTNLIGLFYGMKANVVHADRRPIGLRAIDRD